MTDIAVSEVVWREDLYPRIETNPRTVDQYAEDLTVLPPIEVNQRNELIDGWHRWTAHRKAGAERISVTVTETSSEAHFLELAIRRNATHGLQLSLEDKKDMARTIYNGTPEREREGKKAAQRGRCRTPRTPKATTSRCSGRGRSNRSTRRRTT